MKDKLSKLIKAGKNPENYLLNEEIKDLLKPSVQLPYSKAKEFRPSNVSSKFKLFKAIIMISIIGFIIIAITQFGLNTVSNTPAQTEIISWYDEQSVVATDTLQVSVDTINQKVGDRIDSLKGISLDTKLLDTSGSQLIVDNKAGRQSNDNSPAIQSEVDSKSEIKQTSLEPFEIDKLILEPVLISNDVLDCFGIDSIVRSFDKMHKSGVWGSNIYDPEEQDNNIGYMGVFDWQEWGGYLDSLPVGIFCGATEDIYLDQMLEFCIPFQSETIGNEGEYQVYWIFPSDKLLDCLPDSISDPMRLELIKSFNITWGGSPVAISPPKQKESDAVSIATMNEDVKSAPCNYIPSFYEGISGLDNLNAYPNPVTDQLNVEVILNHSTKIQYRILDIAGRVLYDDLPVRDYSESGRYTEQINLHDLKAGIYLLVLTDNQGARKTKRIMKN